MILCLLILIFGCSGLQTVVEKDDMGRVTKRVIYSQGKPHFVEEIHYNRNSTNPSIIKYKKLIEQKAVPWREEYFIYENEIIAQINFFIYIKNQKIQSGRINYLYSGNKPKRVEYYSILNLVNKKIFRTGLDLYNYSKDNLISRRIIEYEYNPKTKRVMQISQYVIYLQNKNILKMKIWELDELSKNIFKKEENNLNIILKKINDIEDVLSKKAKGMRFI